jgi:alpha-L-glutamate ligase-like protein
MRSWWKKNFDDVLGINERNLAWVYTRNPRKHFDLANNKVLTKQILIEAGIPVARQLCVIQRVGEIAELWSKMEHVSCAIKPAHGSGGGGILVLGNDKSGWINNGELLHDAVIHKHIANILFGVYSFGSDDVALIETKIEPHEAITSIYHQGVADLRIIVCDNVPIMAMLRIPTAKSGGKANLHQGALGVGIALETGRTTRAFNGSQYLDIHPDSGHDLTNIPVPFWKECLDIALRTSQTVPLNYIGVDIAFDQNLGPLVLEINVRPGLEIQNVNQLGLKHVLPRS